MSRQSIATILLVDDNEPKRYALGRYLRQAGYQVVELSSGRECLEQAAARVPDIIILDVSLPDIDGFEICRQIKDNPRTRRIRVLHCSAHFNTGADRVRGLESGSDAYLIEPFEPRELLAQMEALLRVTRAEEAQAQLAAIVECSENAIISKDVEGNILTWNDSAERLFGYTAREAIGQSITLIIPPELHADEVQIMERLRRGERIPAFETVRVHKNGKRIEVMVGISPVCDRTGAVTGASSIIQDITERKEAQRALNEANAQLARANEELEDRVRERTARLNEVVGELEAFSYSLSHDLRAPLRAIQSFTRVLQLDFADQMGPVGASYIEKVLGAARRLDQLVQDVLVFSRISRADVPLQSVHLDTALSSIINENRDLQLAELKVQRPLPSVTANDASLRQCLSNLLGNAVKYVAPGVKPKVRIWAEEIRDKPRHPGHSGPRFVRLNIQDNGVGIPKEAHEKVFQLFYRYHNGYEGTGLGLAIVRKAAERMGARVGLESEPGHGSRFWLDLQPEKSRAKP